MIKPTFEECINRIDNELQKRRSKWTLTALSWMDFDDVSQIIRHHISKKWSLYDAEQPLEPWVNRIISHQIRNLIRNYYGNYSRPCLKCTADEGNDLCSVYGKQCEACPLYAKWMKTKKRAHDCKLPVSMENHQQEVFDCAHNTIDFEKSSENLHVKMKEILKPKEWLVYELLYIKHLSENEVAAQMDFKTSEKNRQPGYRQIKNIEKSIIAKAKKVILAGEVDIY